MINVELNKKFSYYVNTRTLNVKLIRRKKKLYRFYSKELLNEMKYLIQFFFALLKCQMNSNLKMVNSLINLEMNKYKNILSKTYFVNLIQDPLLCSLRVILVKQY